MTFSSPSLTMLNPCTYTRSTQPGVVDGSSARLVVYLRNRDANPAIALPSAPWDPYLYVYNTQEHPSM